MATTIRTALILAFVTFAPAAAAEDAERLEEHEEKGYFDKVGRLGAFAGVVTGTQPTTNTAGATGATEDYKRTGFGMDFDLLGFWDTTRFDTLIGAELRSQFGAYTAPKVEGATATENDKTHLFFRTDAAMDYGLIHWDGAIKGRISGGAGFGFDLNGGRWWTQSGRAYPLLLGRVQLQVGGLGLHAAYHYLPTTTNSAFVREHRFEAAAGIGALHGGLRYTITPARFDDTQPWLITREAGLFIAYAF
jgi:hypothetical protein